MRTAWSKGRTAARLVAVFALALVALAGMCALAPAGTRGYAWAGERVLAEWDDIADGGNAWWSTDGSTLLNIERESGLAVILSPDSTLPVSTLVLTLSGDGTLTARFDELQPEESGQAWIEGWNLDFASAITGARLVADSDSDPEPVTDPVAVTFDLNGHGSFPEGTAVDGDGTATLEASGGSVAPPLPADADYDFAGWFTADGARFAGAVTESTTVYARWVAEDPSVQSPVYSADSVTFNYYGPLADYDPLSDRVCVVGDFNSWGSAVNPMAYDETTGYWSATVPRSSFFYPDCLDTNGPNRYMFVDQSGNYFCDPLNPASDHGFSDFTIPHIFSEEWTYDAGYHWHGHGGAIDRGRALSPRSGTAQGRYRRDAENQRASANRRGGQRGQRERLRHCGKSGDPPDHPARRNGQDRKPDHQRQTGGERDNHADSGGCGRGERGKC